MGCSRPSIADIQSVVSEASNTYILTLIPENTWGYNTFKFYVYDQFGRLVGGSLQNYSKAWNQVNPPDVSITIALDGMFSIGDEFVITCDGNINHDLQLGLRISTNEDYAIINTLGESDQYYYDAEGVNGSASHFGQGGKCRYKMSVGAFIDEYEGQLNPSTYQETICTPPPYEYAYPALEEYNEYTENGTVLSGTEFRNVYFWDLLVANHPVSAGGFMFAVDNNGLIRLVSQVAGGGWFFYLMQGVTTTGFGTGSQFSVYIAEGRNLKQIVNPDREDGKYILLPPSTLTETQKYAGTPEDIYKVGEGGAVCPPNLNVSVWGWLDEVDTQLSTYEGSDIEGLTTQNLQYSDWFEENANTINDDIFKMEEVLGLIDPEEEDADSDPT